jgi:hypothetical protein
MLPDMPPQQLFGIVLIGIGIADTAVGHLLVAPRVADEKKRGIVKLAFAISGIGIVGLGLALYQGLLVLE